MSVRTGKTYVNSSFRNGSGHLVDAGYYKCGFFLSLSLKIIRPFVQDVKSGPSGIILCT